MIMQKKNPVFALMGTISACVVPAIPVMIGCGVIKLVVLLLELTGVFSAGSQTKLLLDCLDSAPFYFLPLLIANASAKHFGCNPMYALAAVSLMLYPDFAAMLEGGEVQFLGIPVLQARYSFGVLQPIALVYALKWIEAGAEKWIPRALKSTFVPAAVILLTGLLGIIAIGPAVTIFSGWLSDGLGYLQMNMPMLAWVLMGFILPPMILTGTHFVFMAIAWEQLGSLGYETGFRVTCFIMTFAITGACLGVFLKSKGKIRENALSHGIAILTTGVSEPALYGTLLPLKTPLLASMLGTAVGAIWQGLHTMHSYVYSTSSIFGVLTFISAEEPMNLLHVLIAAAIGMTAGLAFTLLIYRAPKEQ